MNYLSRIIVVSVVLISCLSSVCLAGNFPSQAVKAAEKFTQLLDNKEYRSAYSASSALLKMVDTEPEWVKERELSGLLLGTVQDRKLVSIHARDTYPGLPDDEYLVIYFEARTQRKAKAAEVLLVSLAGEAWQVCSYHLK
ncbi:Protein of unknown function [Desulfuromusa kysingii]|uniref:DUF4019 domain-containing protein n=1 Tax=Desulfuromusa kysingii TaxID=37625 RepID=A0A1H4ASS0_9BACT|nr:DUF4019 domain-containing protein [Desulfuromusa kysingii]SEA38939.1 Protein of unknown function [Desulfuromusa kysingii]